MPLFTIFLFFFKVLLFFMKNVIYLTTEWVYYCSFLMIEPIFLNASILVSVMAAIMDITHIN